MTGIAVFDMNETTLDLGPVAAVVDRLLSEGGAGFTVWFQKLLQLSMTTGAVGEHVEFGTLADHALTAVADATGVELADDAWPSVAATIGSIQPHPEVPAALDRLRNGGWTLVALTNSGQATVEAQCEGADLTRRFDHILSVDRVRTFKPAPAPYRLAAETVGADPSDLWMVACHDWDLAGARAVGLRTAYVRRTGMAYARTYPAPDLDVWDFGALADHLLGGR